MASINWDKLVEAAQSAPESSFNDEELPVNFSGVAEVVYAQHKPTSGGKDMYSLKFKATEGPYAGGTVWHNLVISPESPVALSIFFQQLAGLGIDRSELSSDAEANSDVFLGRVAVIKLGTQKNDKTRIEVKSIKPAGDVVPIRTAAVAAPTTGPAVPKPARPF